MNVEAVTVLGVTAAPGSVRVGESGSAPFTYDETTQVLTINATIPLTGDATLQVESTQPYTGEAKRSRAVSVSGFGLVMAAVVCLL